MENRAIAALLLAGALAVPAMSQQPQNTPSQDQPAAQSQPASTQPGAAAATPADSTNSQSMAPSSSPAAPADQSTSATGKPLQPPAREGFWGHLNPFARKKYVQRQTQPIRDRLNELDELASQNGKNIKDVDARAQQGIQMASAKANEADRHAIDAGNRAQAAQQTAQQAQQRLQSVEQVVTNIDQYQPTAQTEILFRAGQTALSKKAKDALDQMATPLKNQRGYVVEVQGFSSGRGQAAIQNSQKMAESVVRYLVLNHDIPVYRIYLVGMGNAPVQAANTGEARPKRTTGGRVEISLLKNNLEQLASNGQPAAMQAPAAQAPAAQAPAAQAPANQAPAAQPQQPQQ